MPILKLKTDAIEDLPFTDSGQVLYWDTDLKGFGLRVSTSRKTYFVEAKVAGATIRRTLKHPHPQMTAIQARREALALLANLREGIDPREEQKARAVRRVTFREAAEAYLSQRALKPLTVRDYRRAIDTHLADWASMPMSDISRDMVSLKHSDLGKRSHAQANLAMRFVRAVFNFAIEHYENDVKENPVRRLAAARKWYRIERRKRYVAPHQMKVWFDAVEGLKNESPGDLRETFRDYLFFLLFTGLRRSEAASLSWDTVDFEARTFTIVDPKNHNDHVLPMCDFVHNILTGRRIAETGRYVFPGQSAGSHIVEPRKAILKVCSVSGVEFRSHDLRRTFSGVADSLDIPFYAIKRLLNHKAMDVTEGYLPLDIERCRERLQRIETAILKQAGRLPSGAILPFRASSTEQPWPSEATHGAMFRA